jgi:hypothetical protein
MDRQRPTARPAEPHVTSCLAAVRLDGRFIVFAPLQPLIGAASLVLLAGTLAWRFRLRARGGACLV